MSADELTHPLDRPIWNCLNGRQAHLATGDALAVRIDRDYGPFGAAADRSEEAQAALAALIPADGEMWLPEAEDWPMPAGVRLIKAAPLTQMVATQAPLLNANGQIVMLGADDVDAMAALAEHAQPGPWGPKTWLYGPFYGIKQEGRLAAMAGQRMLVGNYAEVSGVATYAEFRGRGFARALIAHVMSKMAAHGETPFLHSYAHNAGAIALYESLGFRIRRQMTAFVIARG